MQTTIASFSSPNAVLQDAGLSQLMKRFYGLSHSIAPTDYIDAKYPGYQSGSERALKVAALASCGDALPSVGQLKNGLICSPEQACLDIEAFDWMHHFLRGIEVSEDTLCLDLIRERGIGGSFLETDHTFSHFREELFMPKLADRNAQTTCDMVGKAREEVSKILAATPEFSRDKAMCREIDRLYEHEVRRRNA
jgi:trimethylamine--corrinoid protein Co-methyltransferase